MEKTTLQQRIEERAKHRLQKDLVAVSEKESEIQAVLGRENYEKRIEAGFNYNSYDHHSYFKARNNFTEAMLEKLLPKYVQEVTDEILQKVDEIDFLLKENESSKFQDY